MAKRGWSVPSGTQRENCQKLWTGEVLPLDGSLLTLQRRLVVRVRAFMLSSVADAQRSTGGRAGSCRVGWPGRERPVPWIPPPSGYRRPGYIRGGLRCETSSVSAHMQDGSTVIVTLPVQSCSRAGPTGRDTCTRFGLL